ncbi:class I SAM-dependent methyltransferase [Candidatus Chloroploca asiatica]|uniref:class I SAM-dependent methyltransferase n=1 Tax=Candidatus Chloroploca asiatica TaxID=1506545 RepID=UPI000BE7FA14|nr:class I SAM-dependent methyltransferase [Candidatus Chloroploca asiatica]
MPNQERVNKMQSIDDLKQYTTGNPKYRLTNANVFVSQDGYHYIDYLDPVEKLSPEIDANALTDQVTVYIENQLQSNPERFEKQAGVVKQRFRSIRGKRILDIGCGGGLFLSKLKKDGAQVIGIELSDPRAQYARTKHNLEIVKRPIEDDFWKDQQSSFDVVTLWDVIEHVNYPEQTLRYSAMMLKTGGCLFIDTPCRDSFYHRFGEITYKYTNGRFPTFLNAMYSAHPFGHKQIFSSSEIRCILERVGLEVVSVTKFHELSFPYSFYLKRLLKSDLLVNIALPVVSVLLWLFPVKNKMLVIGCKK